MAKRPQAVHQLTSAQFDTMFPVGDEDACKAYLKARRWPQGVACPRCGNAAVYDLPSRAWHWQCAKCSPTGYRFSVTVGTIFENTNKPLRDWYKLVHLMMTSKKGISARQLGRYMGFGSVKTAWLMSHKIRVALIEPETKLGGIVEVDETFIGGRKGNVVARVVRDVRTETLVQFVRETVSNKVSLLCTDDAAAYRGLKAEYPHGSVDHKRRQYVVGAVHTNTIEGFWSIFKRGIVGTFHKVSAKYLPLYVAEFQFRYNNRLNDDIFGVAITGC
jgi:ISXO2-like transposase domain/Transposase zinc-ribbon domain